MIDRKDNSDAEVAIQYLTWALEAIEKFGHQIAADHTRMALEELRRAILGPSDQNDEPGS